MRKKLIAANWKMNLSLDEVENWMIDFNRYLASSPEGRLPDIVVFSPALYLPVLMEMLPDNSVLDIGSQNVSQFPKGAYTGEIAAFMLHSLQIPFVLLGHSERRKLFLETDDIILEKMNRAREHDLKIIFCCGEGEDIRTQDRHKEFVARQLSSVFRHLSPVHVSAVSIAYEPVWAIGTGKNATPEQIQEMHAFIRSEIALVWGQSASEQIRILYGGSCSPSNATSVLQCPDVDGALIGGASLQVNDFIKIVQSAL